MRALTDFEEVYAVYFDDVYRYLLSLSGSESVAEELTSETSVASAISSTFSAAPSVTVRVTTRRLWT